MINEEEKKLTESFLLLDAGNLFFRKAKSHCDPEELGRADLILRSYQHMGYDAINLSQTDLALGVPFLLEKAKEMKIPFLSSNLMRREKGDPVFAPFAIQRINDVRIGILGLMDPIIRAEGTSDYKIKNPYNAARAVLNALKGKADLVIALSSLSKEKNTRLLSECKGIDFLISTERTTHAPIEVNGAFILSSGNRGKYLGRLEIILRSLQKPLELVDLGNKRRLETRLQWINDSISKLNGKKEDILKSASLGIKEKYSHELDRLKKQEEEYRLKLSEFATVRNAFDNRIIPLVAKRPQEAVALSKKRKQAFGMTPRVGSRGPHIEVSAIRDTMGESITFVVSVKEAPSRVRALGFDVIYDPKVLRYSGYAKGELVTNFDMFDASKIKDGLIRAGGFEARDDFIAQGRSGELLRLKFHVTGKGKTGIQLVALKDNISSWGVKEAQFQKK